MRRRRGYTLIEMLVVLFIISVLAALILGGLSAARKTNQIKRTEFQGLYRRLDVSMCSNNGNRDARSMCLHPFDKIEAIAVRQAHIGQAEIE